MTQRPLISVALSVYNGARFLRRQLDSILAQRDVRIEVVAVDDGSRDGSVALLREYMERDPRVQLHVNPQNLGPTRSFERAMSLCRGEFLAPSDQDDFWQPDKLATLLAAIGEHDLAYCDSEYIDSDDRPSGRRISDDLDMLRGTSLMQFVFANSVSGHAALLRRSLFEEVRPLPPGLYYDWVLAMFAAARNGIVYVDQALVQFRRHQEAFSSLGTADRVRPPSRNRAWFNERKLLLQALIGSRFDGNGSAARTLQALEIAVSGQSRLPLLRAIWRERDPASHGQRSAAFNAIRLQSRVLRKLHRARGEPELVDASFDPAKA
ncbi:glycosyltransferase involved in cell wall biosynthesis [Rhodanobacter sp. TND4EL1]